jgi:DUF4097 and DUF4098 domain-containing protein YvlB
MRTSLIVLLILIVVILLSGCFTNTGYIYANSDQYSIGDAEFDLSNVQTIDISWISGNVEVEGSGEVTNVQVSEEVDAGTEEKYQMHHWLNNGTLYIKFTASMSAYTHLFQVKNLTVLVPTNFNKKVIINSVSSNINVCAIKSELDLDSVSGIITLSEIESASCDINNVSGKLQMENISFDDCDIDLTSGQVAVTDSEINNFNLNAVSSSISLSLLSAPSSCDIETVSGNMNITLPASANFSFTYDRSAEVLIQNLP